MKLLLVIFAAICVIGVYSSESFLDKIHPQVEECLTELNVDRQKYLDMVKNPNFIRDRDTDCLSACLLRKRNLMNANGKFTADFETRGIDKMCKAEYGKDECETASTLITCLRKMSESIGNVNAEISS